MPYVKPREVPFAKVARTFKGYLNVTSLAASIGMSHQTMSRRLSHPEEFTLRELRELSIKNHIPKEEIINSITW